MFNRQPFNRGKFNVQTTQSIGNSGIGLMLMKVNPIFSTKIISAKGASGLSMGQYTIGTIVKYDNSISNMMLKGEGEGTKVYITKSDISNLVMGTDANQLLSGESVISLEGLRLNPGDELIINTCDMTITINGQNAMEYFSDDSEFFNLLSGLNTLIYSDSNSSRNISFDVIWKDRWL